MREREDDMIELAIDRYDRHLPFFDGTVTFPRDTEIRILQVGQTTNLRDGTDRHERMLQQGAYDAAETSLASYICLLYTSPSPRDGLLSRMPSSA